MCNGFPQKTLGDALQSLVRLLYVSFVEVDVNVVVFSITTTAQPRPNARNLSQNSKTFLN